MRFKLKYQGGATKKICMALASVQRKKFSNLLCGDKLPVSAKNNHPDLDIISFSGKRDLDEQALSIYSFLYHVGEPKNWILYSDGSYTNKEKQHLYKTFPFIQFREWNFNKVLDGNILLDEYLKVCHLSKKLRVIIGHEYKRQTIYVDSDIVFYKSAFGYFNSEVLKKGFWYLVDASESGLKGNELNSGLMVLNKEFNFDCVYEYLKNLNGKYEYFSEQRSFNYAFKKQHAAILDPSQFIVNLDDQFDFSMAYANDEISVRHYVTPVRHKMWQKGWRWHFE